MKRYYVDREWRYEGMWPIRDRNKNECFNEIAYGMSRREAEKIRDALNIVNEMHNAIKKVLDKVRGK